MGVVSPSPNKVLRVVLRDERLRDARTRRCRHGVGAAPRLRGDAVNRRADEAIRVSSRCHTGAGVNAHAWESGFGGRAGGGRVFRLGVGVVARDSERVIRIGFFSVRVV